MDIGRLKGDRPRFAVCQIFMQPGRVDIRAVGPSKHAKFNLYPAEEVQVSQRRVAPGVGCRSNSRKIGDARRSITESQGKPMAWQHGYSMNPPRCRRDWSSGWVFLGSCLAWHRSQSAIDSCHRVKAGRRMFPPEHQDDDAEHLTDGRHRCELSPAVPAARRAAVRRRRGSSVRWCPSRRSRR